MLIAHYFGSILPLLFLQVLDLCCVAAHEENAVASLQQPALGTVAVVLTVHVRERLNFEVIEDLLDLEVLGVRVHAVVGDVDGLRLFHLGVVRGEPAAEQDCVVVGNAHAHFVVVQVESLCQQEPVVGVDLLHFDGVQNVQVIVAAAHDVDHVVAGVQAAAEVHALVAHALQAAPGVLLQVLAVQQVGHEVRLHLARLHVATYGLNHFQFLHVHTLVERAAGVHANERALFASGQYLEALRQ